MIIELCLGLMDRRSEPEYLAVKRMRSRVADTGWKD